MFNFFSSSVTGAAATAVVTSAVGGPVVMAILITVGTGVAAVGTYELGKSAVQQLENWAKKSELGKLIAEQLKNWAENNCARG